jgi:hypothetical protein
MRITGYGGGLLGRYTSVARRTPSRIGSMWVSTATLGAGGRSVAPATSVITVSHRKALRIARLIRRWGLGSCRIVNLC